MAGKTAEKRKFKKFLGGHECCVVDCGNKTGTGKELSFFHVLRANEDQTKRLACPQC